jgi:Co/Zn/Cd efflux system component
MKLSTLLLGLLFLAMLITCYLVICLVQVLDRLKKDRHAELASMLIVSSGGIRADILAFLYLAKGRYRSLGIPEVNKKGGRARIGLVVTFIILLSYFVAAIFGDQAR